MHLDFVPPQVAELHVAVELEACCVTENVRKVHDPLINLDDIAFVLQIKGAIGKELPYV